MAKIEVVAIEQTRYAGKLRVVGDRFQVTRRHAKLLSALGKVTAAPVVVETKSVKAPEAPKRQYNRRDMSAQKPAGYQRADMSAKD